MIIFLILFIIICLISCTSIYFSKKEKKKGGAVILAVSYEPHYSRKLSDKNTPYFEKRPHDEMMILKLGQRKLLMNELELYTIFLKKFPRENTQVVYAGAAAGFHSTLFAELFPDWIFHFYDTNPFSEELMKYQNIKLYRSYFMDKDAYTYTNRNYKLIFLSDIRTGTYEESVISDMELQKQWCKIMKPDLTMLKFRLPWKNGKTSYFKGEIYTQPRIGPTSTEMRLIFKFKPEEWEKGGIEVEYDNSLYNDRCFFYQRHQRCAFHEINNFDEISAQIQGLCHCNDCWSELEICKSFLSVNSKFREKNGLYSSLVFLETDVEKDKIQKLISFMKIIGSHSKSNLNQPPHNLMVNERNINKKKRLLSPITIKYFNKLSENFND